MSEMSRLAGCDGPWQDDIAPAAIIDQLPPEILAEILLISMDTDVTNPVSRLKDLATVARHWRDLILATPSLWCHINCDLTPIQAE